MSDETSSRNGLIYFLAGAGITYAYTCWRDKRQHAQRKAAFAAGSGFDAGPPQLAMRHQPMQQVYARPMPPQQPLQQPRPQFAPPPQPAAQVQNMLPANPQVAPFSVPTPPPMQYPEPPQPPDMRGGYGDGNNDSSGYATELQGF